MTMIDTPLIHQHSHSEEDTIRSAQELAFRLQDRDDMAGILLCLHGTLGMGKSVFARALIRTLCNDDMLDVPSPTFTLVQTYDASNGTPLYHFDLYRLQDPEEVYELGWDDAISEGLCIVEWPERLGYLLPARRVDIRFKGLAGEPEHRQITIEVLQLKQELE